MEPNLQFRTWGESLLEKIQQNYRLERSGLYKENLTDKGPTFMWTGGILLSAFVAATRVDKNRWAGPLDTCVRGLELYWNTKGPVPGYDVLPVPKPVDRYYDDNAWVAIALVEAAEVTGRAEYARLSERTQKYVLSGEDTVLGGGIYWKEAEKTSKNTCSNGPSAYAAIRLYEYTKNPKYLADAKRLYDWTRSNLQDKDGLFWDNIKPNGNIERTKWSYNTALMLRTACGLARATKDTAYRQQAKDMAEASAKRWLRVGTGAFDDGARFGHLLAESLLDYGRLSGEPRWQQAVTRGLTFLQQQGRDPNGFYTSNWDKPAPAPIAKPELIDQASAVRAFLVLSANGDAPSRQANLHGWIAPAFRWTV